MWSAVPSLFEGEENMLSPSSMLVRGLGVVDWKI